MEWHEYEIVDIQGDYAQLKSLDEKSDDQELFSVAMALLPFGSDVGTRLSYSMGMFEMIG